jgi:hypothetical protein
MLNAIPDSIVWDKEIAKAARDVLTKFRDWYPEEYDSRFAPYNPDDVTGSRVRSAVLGLPSYEEFLEDYSKIADCDKKDLEIEITDDMDVVIVLGDEAVAILDYNSGEFLTREELELFGWDLDALEHEPDITD